MAETSTAPPKIDGWGTVVDPSEDCKVERDGDKVSVVIPGRPHDFAAELKIWNAPRIMRDVEGDFIVDVKSTGEFNPRGGATIEGRKAYHGAGILLVVDNDNHASLQRAAFWDGKTYRNYLNFEVRHDGKVASSQFDLEIPQTDCWLRMERQGNSLYALTSVDGYTWKSYKPMQMELPDVVQFGIEAINSSDRPFECGFESLAVYRKMTVDSEKK